MYDEFDDDEDPGPIMALFLLIGALGAVAGFIYLVCWTLFHFGVIG